VDLLTLLALRGPHGIHGLSDPLETGSDGPCGFPDPLGSPELLVLAVTRDYLFLLVSLVLWFLLLSRMAPR
jgi:hypothetical protein